MPLQSVYLNGQVRLLAIGVNDTARQQFLQMQENDRRLTVHKRRLYYCGQQYDVENLDTAAANDIDLNVKRMPEQLRRHAYSTSIQESVDFISHQLAQDFAIEAEDPRAQQVIDATLAASPDVSGADDDDDVSITNVLRDALLTGDTPVRVLWDPAEATPYLEFWESEAVEFRTQDRNRHVVEKVIVEQIVWDLTATGDEVQVVERQEWTIDPATGEAIRSVFIDEEDGPREVERLGIPFLPWALLRGQRKNLRAVRGESIVTEQAMAAADRYNAVEQVAFLIARYNSHGNLVVVGDAAMLQAHNDERVEKDVADVLAFPGGTHAFGLSLPTDPAMIEHQRQVLLDSIFGAFGLTRVDNVASNTGAWGAVSGYALEILNRKTEATFQQIRQQYTADMKNMLGMVLDMQAYKAGETDLLPDELADDVDLDALQSAVAERIAGIDPRDVFGNRAVEIRLGSGYIVDDVMIRDDYVAGLISRREALRLRGRPDDEIDVIEGEIEEDQPIGTEGTALSGASRRIGQDDVQAGRTLRAADG